MKDYRGGSVQSFTSDYGRKGIRVSAQCPTRAIRYHLGRVNVATPPVEVEAEVRAEIERQKAEGSEAEAWTPQLVKDTVRFTLWQHAENLAEYRHVMGGH